MAVKDRCVRRGTWLYDDSALCRVEIWQRSFRPGSGDYEDPPELADDSIGEWYEVLYEPAGGGRMGHASGGYHSSLQAAIESVRIATYGTIRWEAT